MVKINNKIVGISLAMLLSCTMSYASEKVHVTSIESFSTTAPSQTIDLKVIEPAQLGEHVLAVDDVIHCNVVKVFGPKRGKMSAGFKVEPVYYIHESEKISINQEYVGKYASKVLSPSEIKNIDAKKAGKKAALTVGNHFVKGVAPVASLAEGMIKNEEGNRLESGVKQVYNDSVFSYVQKGKDLNIKPGDSFYILFKNSNTDDASETTVESAEED